MCIQAFPADVAITDGQQSMPGPGVVDVGQLDGNVGLAAGAILEATTPSSCCLILFTENDTSSLTDSQKVLKAWQRQQPAAVFQVVVGNKDTNVTQSFSQLIPRARHVRRLSRCTVVMVVSHNPSFLGDFAEWSLRGRLLVWASRLMVVTRLTLPEISTLLSTHFTFSMMNAIFLNSLRGRFQVFSHLPYTAMGPRVVQAGYWTPTVGLTVTEGHSIFQEKFSNFYGARLNVTALPYGPYWEERHESDNATNYSGTDYLTLAAIATSLNFTVHVLPTSSWTEVMRFVAERKAFFAPVIHTVLAQRLEKIDFSVVYEMSPIGFSMATPTLEARWQALYYPLSNIVWAATLLALLLVPICFYILMKKIGDTSEGRSGKLGVASVFLDMMGMLLGQSLLHHMPNTSSSRILVTAWLVFAVILGSAYSGNLTASLTLPKYPARPETLPQLVDAVDRITMPPYGEEFRNYFAKSGSPVFQKLARLIDIVPSLLEGQLQASKLDQGHLDNQRYQRLSIAETFTQPDGRELLYIGRESIMPGEAAWPLPHDAPYASVINRLLMAVNEGGLYEHWGDELLFKVKQKSRTMHKLSHPDQDPTVDSPPSLTIIHMQGAFMVLILGCGLAVLAFTGEVLLV
ncbi:ionotropic receptor 93a-like [Scylla paramamosain]|uniref:ionotropic receptor 93a-like n=1 Tax=Scylla paramamosain TaxID=85552 RepID=UPI00308274A5